MLLGGFVIALTFEYLGSATGFLFGDYDYTDTLGPRFLGEVPLVIPLAWFMMLYPSWVVGGRLVTYVIHRFTPLPLSSSPDLPYSLLRILIAAPAMTAWDLSLDPRMVADGAWVWMQSGAYFGIPLSNYFGWFVTAAVIFTFWTFVDFSFNRNYPRLKRSWTPSRNPTPSETATQNLAIWVYAAVWLGESIANAIFWSGVGVAVCVFVGMGMFALPALWILRRDN
jgi:putative membrane protein